VQGQAEKENPAWNLGKPGEVMLMQNMGGMGPDLIIDQSTSGGLMVVVLYYPS